MTIAKNIPIILVVLFIFVSCGKKSSSSSSKSFFSKWTSTRSSVYFDFTGGVFEKDETLYLNLPITQDWIDTLDATSRDTTGLVAGDYYICEMTIYFIGNEKSGQFTTNHTDSNTPAHNACLEWDSNCSIGTCNYNADHLFTKSGSTLSIDYFGTADSGLYGVGSFQ
jgi:hypothetical protein